MRLVTSLPIVFLIIAAPHVVGQEQAWIRQIGSSHYDYARELEPDGSGGVFIAGFTDGDLAGTSAGFRDAWIGHYSHAGDRTWIRQIGTAGEDYAFGLASDEEGGVFVAGHFEVGPHDTDVWLARYDNAGNQQWSQMFGSNRSDTGRNRWIIRGRVHAR